MNTTENRKYKCLICDKTYTTEHPKECISNLWALSPSFKHFWEFLKKDPNSGFSAPTPYLAMGLKKLLLLQASWDNIGGPMGTGTRQNKLIGIKVMQDAQVIFAEKTTMEILLELQKKVFNSLKEVPADKMPLPKKLPYPTILLTQANSFGFNLDTPTKSGATTVSYMALLVINSDEEFVAMGFRQGIKQDGEDASKIYLDGLPLGQAFFDALSILLSERIAEIKNTRLPREYRREAKKIEKKKKIDLGDEEYIKVITLRSRSENGGEGSSTGSIGSFEYHHRWIVAGHLRNQWFPARQGHELIWIDPYVKGPEDAPFLEKVIRVNP